jgi:hypothetical protein
VGARVGYRALYPLAVPCHGLPLLGGASAKRPRDKDRHLQLLMAAHELRGAAGEGDCGKLRELLDGGGAPVVKSGTASSGGRTFVGLIRTFVGLIAFRGLERARGLIW